MRALAWFSVFLAGLLTGQSLSYRHDALTLLVAFALGVTSYWMHGYVLGGEQTEEANEG